MYDPLVDLQRCSLDDVEKAPEKYTYDFPMFALTTDVIVHNTVNDKILLVLRKNDPYKNCWALPGGFVNINELTRVAASRELKEETCLIAHPIELCFENIYDNPDRHPNQRVVSVLYSWHYNRLQKAKANDDAVDVAWIGFDDLLSNKLVRLAFDHRDMIENYKTNYDFRKSNDN